MELNWKILTKTKGYTLFFKVGLMFKYQSVASWAMDIVPYNVAITII